MCVDTLTQVERDGGPCRRVEIALRFKWNRRVADSDAHNLGSTAGVGNGNTRRAAGPLRDVLFLFCVIRCCSCGDRSDQGLG